MMYWIIGGDQQEYGPVSGQRLNRWIKEGRVNAQTRMRTAKGDWQPLSAYPEWTQALEPPPPPAIAETVLPPPRTPSPVPQTNSLALTGVIVSGLGLPGVMCCCGPILSTLGLVLCIIALTQINQNPEQAGSKGLAIAGIVLALLGYLLFAVMFGLGMWVELVQSMSH